MNGQEVDEGSASQQDGEDNKVMPYVDFSDFYRQVDELGEEYVYGWDNVNVNPAAEETPA